MYYVFETDETNSEAMQSIYDYIDLNADDDGLLLEASPMGEAWCLNGAGDDEEYHALDRGREVVGWSTFNHVVVIDGDDNSFITIAKEA